MAEYDLAFAELLARNAIDMAQREPESEAAVRAIWYTSLVSVEVSLKALLEAAGVDVGTIKKRGHDLATLLDDVTTTLTIERVVVPGAAPMRVVASDVRALTVDKRYADATVGVLLDFEKRGGSIYPNNIRYGNRPKNFPPEVMAKLAQVVAAYAREHLKDVRKKGAAGRGTKARRSP